MTFYNDFLVNLQSIYSDEEYTGMLLLQSCNCVLSFNFEHFVVPGPQHHHKPNQPYNHD